MARRRGSTALLLPEHRARDHACVCPPTVTCLGILLPLTSATLACGYASPASWLDWTALLAVQLSVRTIAALGIGCARGVVGVKACSRNGRETFEELPRGV